MSESQEKQASFLGTYFERNAVLRLSRWSEIASWVVLALYLVTWWAALGQFIYQYTSGLFGDKGMTFLNAFNMFTPYILQPLPGVFFFFGLQAVSHLLLIFLDLEDNTRRAARNK